MKERSCWSSWREAAWRQCYFIFEWSSWYSWFWFICRHWVQSSYLDIKSLISWRKILLNLINKINFCLHWNISWILRQTRYLWGIPPLLLAGSSSFLHLHWTHKEKLFSIYSEAQIKIYPQPNILSFRSPQSAIAYRPLKGHILLCIGFLLWVRQWGWDTYFYWSLSFQEYFSLSSTRLESCWGCFPRNLLFWICWLKC